jgi:uncharacterized protein YrzB (UPF0473 family)
MTCGERYLLTKGITDSVNLSEKHLLYGYYHHSGDIAIPTTGYKWYNTTGSFYMPVAALAELLGAADENKYPYTMDPLSSNEYTDDIAHLEEAIFLPNYPSKSSSWKGDLWNAVNEKIKEAVMEYGAVWVSMDSTHKHSVTEWYTEWPLTSTTDSAGNTTITYGDKPQADHAVTIVGWNDEKVIPGAENPGAFYIQNSWGADWGESGYCWLSYEDASLNNPVTYRMELSELGKTRDTEVFSHTGTGFCGKVLGSVNLNYGVNVYTTDHAVIIDSVGFYTKDASEYEVEIITLEDDLGHEQDFEFLDVVEYNNDEYIILLPVEGEEEEQNEVMILKIESIDDETENYVGIDDEETLQKVFDIFKKRYEDQFDFED